MGIRVSTIKDAEGKEIVDPKSTINISSAVIEKYVAKETPILAKNKAFMKEIQTPDQFMLAMVGNLLADHYFVEGVCLGLENPSDYVVSEEKIPVKKEVSEEKKKQLDQNIQKELQKVANCPITSEMVLSSSQKYAIPVEYLLAIMKNDSSYGTQ
ncbi:MAG: hypothetical protein WCJ39_07885 [bacterium]